MGKANVIILYVIGAIFLLLLISHNNNNNDNHHRHHRGRRLKIRSNFTFTPSIHHAPFDPLVADIERKREDRQWAAVGDESQPEWEDFMDAEDYLNDEEKFNVSSRLVLLFPKIDVDPPDGYVSEAELTQWNLHHSQKEVLHRTQREMELHDKDKDGFVSFQEYQPPSWATLNNNNNTTTTSFGYHMGWWKQDHFNASDADADARLNITEFNDFLHPADTNNPNLLLWLCQEEIRERDSDRDGKVNFKEFFHGLFDLVRNYDEVGHNSSHESDESVEAPAKKLFDQLDKDGDGYLSDVELLPIIEKLHPSEHYYAKQQAEYILQQADSDKDGRLTLMEMIDNPYVFYSAVFNEDEDEDDYGYHDEFR